MKLREIYFHKFSVRLGFHVVACRQRVLWTQKLMLYVCIRKTSENIL